IELEFETNPDLTPHLVIIREHGSIRCIAPFYIQNTHLRLQFSVITIFNLPIKTLSLFGDDFIVAENTNRERLFLKVFDYLLKQPAKFGLIHFDRMIIPSPLWEYCVSKLSKETKLRLYLPSIQREKMHLIRLASTAEEYVASLSPKTRQNLRRSTR